MTQNRKQAKDESLSAKVKAELDKVLEFTQEYETRENPVTRSVYRDMIRSRLDRIEGMVSDGSR